MSGIPSMAGQPGFDRYGRGTASLPPGATIRRADAPDPPPRGDPDAAVKRQANELVVLEELIRQHPERAFQIVIGLIASGELRLRFPVPKP